MKVGLRRLLGMNRREWPYLAAGVAASATIGTVQPLFAVILSKATALLTPDEPASNLLRFCLYLFALGAAQLACGTLQVWRQVSGAAEAPLHLFNTPALRIFHKIPYWH